MYELIFFKINNNLYAKFYDEKRNMYKINKADATEIIQGLKFSENKISNLYFRNQDIKLSINKLNITLKNKKDFAKDSNFKFIFNKIKTKRYRLVKPAFKIAFTISLASALALVAHSAVNANLDKNIVTTTIAYSESAHYVDADLADSKDFDTTKEVIETKVETTTSKKEEKVKAKQEITKEAETKVVETTKEVTKNKIDTEVYSSNEDLGFNVTTNNKTYQLSSSEKELLMAIIAAESDKTFDDALATISVILNRCEDPAWVNSHGSNPISQATAPNQFVVYQEGYYKKYMNNNVPNTVKKAVLDALNGVRNNKYLSFRSNGSKYYSDNLISSTGNRYK